MHLYLPIANLSVNALVIVLLGLGVGVLSGMFGVGGGFLTTPLLIVYGIPPTVAAASAASQVTGASVSGVFAHFRRGGVDVKMGGVAVAGGFMGSLAGAALFSLLQQIGQIDTAIAVLYVLMLGSIGGLMLRESVATLRARSAPACGRRRGGGGTIRWSRRCRGAGASTSRGCTSRRSRRCCSASSPASSPSCSASAADSSWCRRCSTCSG